ncbi:hypothetical protein PLEOSDRAFT_1073749 [Pleurotus ostreatus PC15]|uniref:Alpha N-terminal protein methyltransferase 1 n=1 Tax=Pleurotus ostreatus (strain PC15) TaxID=1137138 RepID=A0A067P036_PLEO1|nr:hypothetical protein PLEOSDRAFT_1073749 [Pleurotus ostreatus PC15]
MFKEPEPDIKEGIEYWNTQPASLDGVLGGLGSGSLPRVDAVGSRLFLLNILPELCTIPSALRPLSPLSTPGYRTRALDVGAGIGRVTADVLLPLVSDVVLLEPVDHFVQEALTRGRNSISHHKRAWKGIAHKTKSVTILQGTLQSFHPTSPINTPDVKFLDRVGFCPPTGSDSDANSGFDVIWCQWCLGHLNDQDLVAFFQRCHKALRNRDRSLIIVKENLCRDGDDGQGRTSFDEQDSSLTRSDGAWKSAFESAGLHLIHEKVQGGFEEGLYPVKMLASSIAY